MFVANMIINSSPEQPKLQMTRLKNISVQVWKIIQQQKRRQLCLQCRTFQKAHECFTNYYRISVADNTAAILKNSFPHFNNCDLSHEEHQTCANIILSLEHLHQKHTYINGTKSLCLQLNKSFHTKSSWLGIISTNWVCILWEFPAENFVRKKSVGDSRFCKNILSK